mgnify:CR=1 FL=1
MKKEVLILNCEQCGEEFLYEWSGRGKKQKYCEKCRAERVRQSHNEASKKYEARKHIKKIDNTAVIIHRTGITDDEQYCDLIARITKVLNTLDTTRVEMCELSTALNEYQSSYNKADQKYLHQVEQIDTSNLQEIQRITKEWQASRKNRRNVKDLISLLADLIKAIPYKNYANAIPILRGKSIEKEKSYFRFI